MARRTGRHGALAVRSSVQIAGRRRLVIDRAWHRLLRALLRIHLALCVAKARCASGHGALCATGSRVRIAERAHVAHRRDAGRCEAVELRRLRRLRIGVGKRRRLIAAKVLRQLTTDAAAVTIEAVWQLSGTLRIALALDDALRDGGRRLSLSWLLRHLLRRLRCSRTLSERVAASGGGLTNRRGRAALDVPVAAGQRHRAHGIGAGTSARKRAATATRRRARRTGRVERSRTERRASRATARRRSTATRDAPLIRLRIERQRARRRS